MAIVSVTKIWSGESGGWTAKEGGQTSDSQFTDAYDVVVDNDPSIDTVEDVLADSDVPSQNSAHPNNFYLRAKSVKCNRKSPILFRVVAGYVAVNTSNEDGNPVNEPARVKYKTVKTDGEIDEDINGDPIQTVNGEKITGVRRKFSDIALHVSKNFTTFNVAEFYKYIDAVNSEPFHGLSGGVCYVDEFEAEPMKQGNFAYVAVSAVIIFRRPIRTSAARAWWSRVLHEGFREKRNSKIQLAIDEAGNPVTSPVKLKSDGTQETNPANSDWLEFEILSTVDFNDMGFEV